MAVVTGGWGTPVTLNDILGSASRDGGTLVDLNGAELNKQTYYSYLMDLMNLYMSMFEWKNLPDGLSSRQLEYYLMTNGVAAVAYDELIEEVQPENAPEGFAALRVLLSGDINVLDLPDERTAYSMVEGINNMTLTPDNSVLVWDNSMRITPVLKLNLYAKRLANLDRTIDVNVEGQKTTKIIRCSTKQKVTLMNALNQQADNTNVVWGDEEFGNGDEPLGEYATPAPYVAFDLQTLKRLVWNEALSFIGIENTYSDKKERMVADEVQSNMGDVEAHRFIRLNMRKDAVRQMRELWPDKLGDVDVDFRSGVYIRTDKDGMAPTSGMQEGSPEGDGDGANTGYGD